MKFKLFLFFSLIPFILFAQEKWTYQSDSLYKTNKVKSRKWYTGKKLTATTYYDKAGRMIKFQRAPFVGGGQRTIYFEYDENGLLINQVDTTRVGKPDKKALKKFKKLGIDLTKQINRDRPEIEVSKFEIEYDNGQISKLTKFNPDGSLYIVDHYENNGGKQIRDWYRNGKKYQQSITEYLKKFYKEKYYGWEIRPNSGKGEWNYTFEYEFDNEKVKKFIRFDDGIQKETTEFSYNDNGLLSQVKYYTTYHFEYEYYK